MKKILLGMLMLGLLSTSYAQYGVIVDYKKETWKELKKKTLYVVYDDEGTSTYDKALKEAVTSNWNFNEVEFINYSSYEEKQKVETNFFLLSVNQTVSAAGRYNESLSYMYIIRGYKKGAKKGDISRFPQLAAVQSGSNDREIYLPLLIKHLNKSIDEVVSGKITSLGANTKKLNVNKRKVKSKRLYLLESDLNGKIKTEADLKEGYVGEVSVISKEELANKIKAGEDAHVFFCARSSTKSYVHIYNAKTGEEYYNSFNLVSKKWPAGIIPYHFKKWNK